ncbi:unnamed protein product, partial [Nesidiocoris tenuis]
MNSRESLDAAKQELNALTSTRPLLEGGRARPGQHRLPKPAVEGFSLFLRKIQSNTLTYDDFRFSLVSRTAGEATAVKVGGHVSVTHPRDGRSFEDENLFFCYDFAVFIRQTR